MKKLNDVRLPFWLGSICVHLFLLLVCAILLRNAAARKSAPGIESMQPVGILLKSEEAGKIVYTGQNETQFQMAESHIAVPIVNPVNLIPVIGVAANLGSGNASQNARSVGAVSTSKSGDGKTTVKFFNQSGTGNRFAFVLDRSGSMAETLGLAKEQLISAIDSLSATNEFSIVFFNHDASVFMPDANREAAKDFVKRISPSGATNHLSAFKTGVSVRPDVIFYLTDGAEESVPSAAELKQIERLAAGIQINIVQFGTNVSEPNWNFLKHLSAKTEGAYTYINTANYQKESDSKIQ